MSNILSVAILCGGRSVEHEISILSAMSVIAHLDPEKYSIFAVYLSQDGQWFLVDHQSKLHFSEQCSRPLLLVPGDSKHPFVLEEAVSQRLKVDCVMPMLHGTHGEDGAVQGLLDILGIPYVSAPVLGSALCMNKSIARSLLRFAGMPTVDWVVFNAETVDQFPYKTVEEQLGPVLFVKPSSLGSSVGISKVTCQQEYDQAITKVLQYDHQVLVEQAVKGREVECSVLGGFEPIASLPGEIITKHDFYSYEAKYCDTDGLQIVTPADLPERTIQRVQKLAVNAFKILQCWGMARVDFFVTAEQDIIINELNTIPGFTDVSMYAKNWSVSGLSYCNLLDELISLALQRHSQDAKLKRDCCRFLQSARKE